MSPQLRFEIVILRYAINAIIATALVVIWHPGLALIGATDRDTDRRTEPVEVFMVTCDVMVAII